MSTLLEQASLVMIPSGYKEDVVYSQIPTDGAGDLSFTRASNGTRINSAGLVEVCPWNLLQYSEQFDNAAWTKQQSTVTANAITAPNGTATADFLVPNTNNDLHSIFQASGITSGKYTISVYAKQGGYKNLLVWFDGHSGGIGVNLDTLAIFRNQNNDEYLIETLANGWYRISVTCTISTASLPNFYIYDNSSTPAISFAGNGTSGVYLWGAQMNYGALKPYFPTTDRLNVPRLTYQNGGGGCPSLLLEKQSTNLITYSENFDQAYWPHYTTGSGTVTKILNNAISPDGTQNADEIRLTRSTLTDDALTYQVQGVGSATYSRTIYLKAARSQDVGKKIQIWSYNGTVVQNIYEPVLTADWVRFDAGTTTGALVEILSFGYLSSSTFPTTSGTDVRFYAWGAQGEASSYPTSYIPTTSSSATRVADACFKTGISSLIGQTEGTMFVDFYYNLANNTPNGSDKGIMTIRPNGGSYSNEIALLYYGDEGGSYGKTIQVTVTVGGALQCSLKTPQTLTNGYYKVAFAYKQNDFAFYVNGTQIGTDTSGSVPTCDELYLVDPLRINPNTTIKEAILFKTRLSNSELASLTTI
jgi:hypothetical protein